MFLKEYQLKEACVASWEWEQQSKRVSSCVENPISSIIKFTHFYWKCGPFNVRLGKNLVGVSRSSFSFFLMAIYPHNSKRSLNNRAVISYEFCNFSLNQITSTLFSCFLSNFMLYLSIHHKSIWLLIQWFKDKINQSCTDLLKFVKKVAPKAYDVFKANAIRVHWSYLVSINSITFPL